MKRLNWWRMACAVCALIAAVGRAAPAQNFVNLVNFNGSNGANPLYASFIQGRDGNLYGTTQIGGTNNEGIVFRLTPSGLLTTIYAFCQQIDCDDGAQPAAGLVLGTDGNFYGTTVLGGAKGYGSIFRVTPTGTLTTLHLFSNSDGNGPYAALTLGTDGDFYGTTSFGGASGVGTIFRISPSGALTTLYSFCAQPNCTDGFYPIGPLFQGIDEGFYGTTSAGGAPGGGGTVFRISSAGTLTTLHTFGGYPTDGFDPNAGLTAGSNGFLYGTTCTGGSNNLGTVFTLDTTGMLSVVRSLDSSEGVCPEAALIYATDGNFYGTASSGGAYGDGAVFKITPRGFLTTIHSFDRTDGVGPTAGVFQCTNGNIYGTTRVSGGGGGGTVFSLALGLGVFVQTLPTVGKVERSVSILGTDLSGSSVVTFNGTPATFVIESPTAIKTTVPAGALTSNVNFQVLP